MRIWPGRLYAGADQYTNMRVSTLANAGDPDQTQVPDPAVAPQTKIQLPGSGSLDQNWLSRDQVLAAASFVDIQVPDAMTNPTYIWANFKNDSFCFAPSRGSPDFLQYLQDVYLCSVSNIRDCLIKLTPSDRQYTTQARWFRF
ncbi:hypothetical protein KVR01_013628 [Diaporthe batatas]|uniref:uncharacterized protein n=1 Tax=Diaporthe batatas TaxID=748121 RepID=UPI001D0458A7|nr:uncharacterized protein KVR01_013628 [Diaporthe batatas]KAG8156524.1 hypothetical protein KVR01_013628 [Diaporthe batatas]